MMSIVSAEPRESLVALFFEAAGLPERWASALQSLAADFHSSSATIGLWPITGHAPTILEIVGPLAAGKAPYSDHYRTIDPHVDILTARPGRWTSNAQFFDERYVQRSEFYRDFLLVHGVRHGAWTVLEYPQGEIWFCASVNRDRDAAPYSAYDLVQLDGLIPSLRRALLLQQKLARITAEHRAATGLMEQLSFGIALVDAAGRVLTMNPKAKAIFEAADGLEIKNGLVAAARTFERVTLAQLLIRCARQPRARSGELLVGRPSGRFPYALLVTPTPA